jgi:hypothetical protein
LLGSAISASLAWRTTALSWLTSSDGSYVGLEYIARIAPVRGSIATTEPR